MAAASRAAKLAQANAAALAAKELEGGGAAPDGRQDGTFNEDYEFVAGLGALDECNGAMTVSAAFPSGTSAYFLTDDSPVVPRCFAGTPDPSFRFGPR